MLSGAADSFRALLEKGTQNHAVHPSPGLLLAAGARREQSLSRQRSLEASSRIAKP